MDPDHIPCQKSFAAAIIGLGLVYAGVVVVFFIVFIFHHGVWRMVYLPMLFLAGYLILAVPITVGLVAYAKHCDDEQAHRLPSDLKTPLLHKKPHNKLVLAIKYMTGLFLAYVLFFATLGTAYGALLIQEGKK